MAKQAPELPSTTAPLIPDKLYFRIGEAARLCGVEAYVLRFWETEFPQLRPNKGGTGQRLYRKRDVELALRIKQLVHQEGYTIAGARQVLATESKGSRRKDPQPELPLAKASASREHDHALEAKLKKLRLEMKELLTVLSGPPSAETRAPRHTGPRREKRDGPNLFE
jgi:DNA-binding transcriptional MerR regulator